MLARIFSRKTKQYPAYSLISYGDIDLSYTHSSLKKHGYDINEQSLLRCIKENKSKNLVYYAVLNLRLCGTKKSVETLKATVSYPMQDIKDCSVMAIAAIAGPSETLYYAGLLDSTFRNKIYAMAALWEVGDDRAYEAVIRFAKKVLMNRYKINSKLEVQYITDYLEKFSITDESTEITKQLQALRLQAI